MLKARIAREIVVRMPNEIGALAQLSKVAADKGINILAISATVKGRHAVVRIITDENLRMVEAFDERGFGPTEEEVVVTDALHKPGMLRRLGEKLALERIDLRSLYATSSESDDHCFIVLSTSNNPRAVVVLNE